MANSELERSGEGWQGVISGMCPVQGDGTIDGHPWYFRARGSRWEMVIAEDRDGDPLDCYGGTRGFPAAPGWWMREPWGTGFDAGYMTPDEAWECASKGFAAFRTGTMNRIESAAQ